MERQPIVGEAKSPLADVNANCRGAYYSLFVLAVVVMFTVLDRQVLALLVEPMKADFGISDTQAALLMGAAFSITYGLAGIPIARLADRTNRRNLVAACIAIWSASTVACGLAQNFAGMFLARLGIGVGESGYGPATLSIVTDSFPRERVALAASVLGLGAMAGVGLASFAGGAVLALVADWPALEVPYVGIIRPWQWAFIVVGLPGVVWALVVMTMREPPRRGVPAGEKAKSVPVREFLHWIADDWRTYLAVVGGFCMKTMMGTGFAAWGATLLHREFDWPLAKIGMVLGIVTIVVSPVAMLAGGKLSEYWTRVGRNDANIRILLLGLLISVPVLIVTPLLPSPYLVIGANAFTVFIGGLGHGPGMAAFQVITPNRMRAQVSSISQFGTHVIAFAISPLIVALFTDYVFRDPAALKYSMALNAAVMGLLSILVTWQGVKPYTRSYKRAVREGY